MNKALNPHSLVGHSTGNVRATELQAFKLSDVCDPIVIKTGKNVHLLPRASTTQTQTNRH